MMQTTNRKRDDSMSSVSQMFASSPFAPATKQQPKKSSPVQFEGQPDMNLFVAEFKSTTDHELSGLKKKFEQPISFQPDSLTTPNTFGGMESMQVQASEHQEFRQQHLGTHNNFIQGSPMLEEPRVMTRFSSQKKEREKLERERIEAFKVRALQKF
jgi:hypothetical protein